MNFSRTVSVFSLIGILHALFFFFIARDHVNRAQNIERQAMAITFIKIARPSPAIGLATVAAQIAKKEHKFRKSSVHNRIIENSTLMPVIDNSVLVQNVPEAVKDSAAHLDLDAIKKSVRKMNLYETAADQVKQHPISNEKSDWGKTADKMAQAARPDCIKAFQNLGVLALVAIPLSVAVDKKDSGCKF